MNIFTSIVFKLLDFMLTIKSIIAMLFNKEVLESKSFTVIVDDLFFDINSRNSGHKID